MYREGPLGLGGPLHLLSAINLERHAPRSILAVAWSTSESRVANPRTPRYARRFFFYLKEAVGPEGGPLIRSLHFSNTLLSFNNK